MELRPESKWRRLRKLHARAVMVRKWLDIEAGTQSILERLAFSKTLSSSAPNSKHSSYISKLKVGVRTAIALQGHSDAFVKVAAKTKKDKKDDKVAEGAVVTVMSTKEELESVELWKQGDETLYTQEKLEKRVRLRRDRRVAHALQMFWEAALRGYGDGDLEAQSIGEEGYANMMRRLYRVILKKCEGPAPSILHGSLSSALSHNAYTLPAHTLSLSRLSSPHSLPTRRPRRRRCCHRGGLDQRLQGRRHAQPAGLLRQPLRACGHVDGRHLSIRVCPQPNPRHW